MRLKITLVPLEEFSYKEITNYTLQGFIYSLLKGSEFDRLHGQKVFKFFCFSNMFPITDYKKGEPKHLLVSSPNKYLIDTLESNLEKAELFRIGIHMFQLDGKKSFDLKLKHRWETATPIVLQKDSKKSIYFSFERDKDMGFFLSRLKENSLKKYNMFYNKEYNFEGPIFDRMKFRKELPISLRKTKKEFVIIGSLWKVIEKVKYSKQDIDFYKFLFDCGLGEKNSLGFGFVNPL